VANGRSYDANTIDFSTIAHAKGDHAVDNAGRVSI
jgi:hypothetical protein